MKLLLITLLVFGACSFKKNNQKQKGHEELYSEPESPKLSSLEKDERRIVIASTNDRHGDLNPSMIFEDDHNNEELTVNVGGIATTKQYFNILRDTFKHVVLVDSGDIFPSQMEIEPVKNFYSELEYDAYTVGLRDFNLKVPNDMGSNAKMFESLAKASKIPLLVSNLYELKTARVVEWKGAKPYVIKDLGGVKVGIIGIIPDDAVAQTPVNNRVGLFVENMIQATLRNSRLLRSLGADVIVVLTHQGIDCNTGLAEEAGITVDKVNFDPLKENVCDKSTQLGEFISKLPPNLVDVVVGGRNHQKSANIVNGIVVMSGFPDGKSMNYTELVVNTKTKKLVTDKTVVHQPVLFCSEFFKETNDCYSSDMSVNHKSRIPATFLGKPIAPVGIAKKAKKLPKTAKDVGKGLVQYSSDISFSPETSGETQLLVVTLTGKELSKILEEDYNQGRKDLWSPSPYLIKGDDLTISITGMEIELGKTYRVLADLEGLQSHRSLKKLIGKIDSEAHMHASWHSMDQDSLNSQMSAQAR